MVVQAIFELASVSLVATGAEISARLGRGGTTDVECPALTAEAEAAKLKPPPVPPKLKPPKLKPPPVPPKLKRHQRRQSAASADARERLSEQLDWVQVTTF